MLPRCDFIDKDKCVEFYSVAHNRYRNHRHFPAPKARGAGARRAFISPQ